MLIFNAVFLKERFDKSLTTLIFVKDINLGNIICSIKLDLFYEKLIKNLYKI